MISSRWPRPIVDHRVDRLDAGLERLLHRLALDDARRLELERAASRSPRSGPAPSSGLPSGSTTRPRSASPTGTRRDLAGAPHRVALLDLLPLAEERDADVVLLEVEREADDAVVELEHLERDAVLEPVDAGDAVAELEHGADLGEVGLDVELLDPLRRIEVISSGRSFTVRLLRIPSRWSRVRPCELAAQLVEAAAHARVETHASRPGGRCRRSGPGRRCASRRSACRACSEMRWTRRPDSSSESSQRRRELESRTRSAAATSASNSFAAISRISPARPFSTSSRTKLRTSSSAAASEVARARRP